VSTTLTYAEVAKLARIRWLEPLAARKHGADPYGLFRPLGARLLLRWLRKPALHLDDCDPCTLGAAHALLAAWIAASEHDETRAPQATAREVLIAELARHWGEM